MGKSNQKVNTITVEVLSPEETIVFKNIRLPEELRQIVPLVSGQSPLEQTYKALTGTPLFGKCVLGQGYVHSFDKKTYNYQIDECDHLVTSDCSKDQEHAVLAKEVNGLKHITIFESKTKIELRPALAYQNYVEDWTCEVNGQKIYLNKNEMKTIKIESDSLLKGECTIYWHSDNVVEINTPNTRITHKGKTVSVEEKSLMADGSHCGLCGDYSMVRSASSALTSCLPTPTESSPTSASPSLSPSSRRSSLRRRSAASTPPRAPRCPLCTGLPARTCTTS